MRRHNEHGVEWCAQLVGERGEKFILRRFAFPLPRGRAFAHQQLGQLFSVFFRAVMSRFDTDVTKRFASPLAS